MASKVQIGINGFGRIGRITFRVIEEQYSDILEVVAINDLVPVETNAHLLRYDSNYRAFPRKVEYDDKSIYVDGRPVRVFVEKDPAKIPWGDLGVDIVLECTGVFTDGRKAAAHLEGGAKKVIISAPPSPEDLSLIHI